ncbi:MAG: redoxin family protein [Planctomycetes bacterium]|nr:redoxin family protein [Planctomycetota bacterium]
MPTFFSRRRAAAPRATTRALVLTLAATLFCPLVACDASREVRDDGSAVDVAEALQLEPGVMPLPRAGAELLGQDVSALLPTRFLGEAFDVHAHRATLVRFWTDTCPHCRRSLPALDALLHEFADDGLAGLAVYHPKPPRPVSDDVVSQAAAELGWTGAVAVDADWTSLQAIWLDGDERRAATSFSLLLDADGVVRFVHPGPDLFPSDDDLDAEAARDYATLRHAIGVLLGEGA